MHKSLWFSWLSKIKLLGRSTIIPNSRCTCPGFLKPSPIVTLLSYFSPEMIRSVNTTHFRNVLSLVQMVLIFTLISNLIRAPICFRRRHHRYVNDKHQQLLAHMWPALSLYMIHVSEKKDTLSQWEVCFVICLMERDQAAMSVEPGFFLSTMKKHKWNVAFTLQVY